jgi:hypothetical protein
MNTHLFGNVAWLQKLTMPSACENTEQLEFSTLGIENMKWYRHPGKLWQFLTKLNIHLTQIFLIKK